MTILIDSFTSKGEEETIEIARGIANKYEFKTIGLSGDLGAGKTIFCKGYFSAFGVLPENIVSPSFNIVNIYINDKKEYFHIDLYRYSHFEDDFGFWDIISSGNYVLIEWAERLGKDIRELDLLIEIKKLNENKRLINVYKFEK
ncbi:tRNA (adenosine(37)-N6)-threonylcarbamoyltransferase complex ATPase subunit type 1 TsaE [bacterium]|nr:tRNA (adenosine(37)-N6)-threonylcarbamoyltransferase complex ATPase subunit type 1 TsaE [bacterium]